LLIAVDLHLAHTRDVAQAFADGVFAAAAFDVLDIENE
jgi:hypothetical protein